MTNEKDQYNITNEKDQYIINNSNSKKHTLFIHKFQPIFFQDFEIDKDIVNVLTTLINIDNLNILLIGDIGCGKTILLNAIIQEYYKNVSRKLCDENILYINNLKEQGINYYRNDVKTFCQIASSIKKKKKIIVLDDIDLINEQSQQVFRNCIDKYNHNVHFICSCSNIQKVIESLQSRVIIIKIKPLQRDNMYEILNKIKHQENIEMTIDAEEFILNVCNNTAKTLINYMEKFKLLNEKITLELANKVCTNINFHTFEEYTILVKKKELVNAIKIIYEIYDKGYSVMDILDNYFLFVKSTNILSENEKYDIIPFICKYIAIFHNIHEDEIELSLFTNNIINIIK
jgi:DNA polymerase III delta prime subunit